MRVIIIAAGEATRWANHTGVTKHFAVLNNEPIIDRTVRLLKNNGVDRTDIYVVSKDYQVRGANNYHIEPNYKDNADADKFLSSANLWDRTDRTIILYGDVYFTEEAMRTIVINQSPEWRLFCRPTPSIITGTKWGECFAVSLYPNHHKQTLERLHHIAKLHKTGVISRCGGWELARAMMGRPDSQIRHPHIISHPLYYVIDDITDDVDYPDDYERLKKVIDRENKRNGNGASKAQKAS